MSEKSRRWLQTEWKEQLDAVHALPSTELAALAAAAGTTAEALQKAGPPELARAVMLAEMSKNRPALAGSCVQVGPVQGDTAQLVVVSPDGKREPWVLVREKEIWRMDGEATTAARRSSP